MFIPLIPSINFNLFISLSNLLPYIITILSLIIFLFLSKKNILGLFFLVILTVFTIISKNLLFSIISLELMWVPLFFLDKPKNLTTFSLWWGLASSFLILYYATLSPIFLIIFALIRLKTYGLSISIKRYYQSDFLLSLSIISFLSSQFFVLNYATSFVVITLFLASLTFLYLYPKIEVYDISKFILLILVILDQRKTINIDFVTLYLLTFIFINKLKKDLKLLLILIPLILYYLIYKINFFLSLQRLSLIYFLFAIYFLENFKYKLKKIKIPKLTKLNLNFLDHPILAKFQINIIPFILGILLLIMEKSNLAFYLAISLISFSYMDISEKKFNSTLVYLALFLSALNIPAYNFSLHILSLVLVFSFFLLEYRLKEDSKLFITVFSFLYIYYIISMDIRPAVSIFISLVLVAIVKKINILLMIPISISFLIKLYEYPKLSLEYKDKILIIFIGLYILTILISFIYKKIKLPILQTLTLAVTMFVLPTLSLLYLLFMPIFSSGLSFLLGPLGILLRYSASHQNNLALLLFVLTTPIITLLSITSFNKIIKTNIFLRYLIIFESIFAIFLIYYSNYIIDKLIY